MSGEEEISMTLERLDYLLIIESLHEKLKRMEPDSVEYKKCNEILKEYREKLKGME